MEATAHAIREIADSPTLHGVEAVRTQLEMVERHIAEAFAHFDQRDEAIATEVLGQVRDHGELMTRETTRIVEAMQAYVQGGTETVGRLAQRIEEHAKLFVLQDHNIVEHVREVVEEQASELTEQVAMVREKVGLHGREQEQLRASPRTGDRCPDARARRADPFGFDRPARLRSRIAPATMVASGDGALGRGPLVRVVDDRMTALEHIVEERMAALERTMGEQVLALSSATSASVERNVERMAVAAGSVDGLDELIAESQQSFEDRMMNHIDERAGAIARLIRSDSQALADRMATLALAGGTAEPAVDGELVRQLIRSIKELEAGMASTRRDRSIDGSRPFRSTAQGDAAAGGGDAQDRRGPGREDRPAVDPGRRRRRERHPDRGRPDVGRDQSDVHGAAGERVALRRAGRAPRAFFTGHSVRPFRSTVTQASSTAIAGRSSMLRTRPPATIVSPMNTGARNCAEMASTASASPAHATIAAAMWPIVNIPWAMTPGTRPSGRTRRPDGAGSGRRRRRRTP